LEEVQLCNYKLIRLNWKSDMQDEEGL